MNEEKTITGKSLKFLADTLRCLECRTGMANFMLVQLSDGAILSSFCSNCSELDEKAISLAKPKQEPKP